MARLGILRITDLKCLMGTFLVIIFFVCVIILIVAQNEQTNRLLVFDFARDTMQSPSLTNRLPKVGSRDEERMPREHVGRRSDRGRRLNRTDAKSSTTGITRHESQTSVKEDEATTRGSSKSARMEEDGGSFHVTLRTADRRQKDFVLEPGDDVADVRDNLKRTEDIVNIKTANRNKEQDREKSQAATKMKKLRLKHLAASSMENFTSPYIDRNLGKPGKKIITWYKPDVIPQFLTRRKAFENCPVSGCKFEFPLSEDYIPDAIIFDGAHWREDPPPRRHSDQAYVFYDMSSPALPRNLVWSPAWSTVFNWTWTYRHDSDIWEPLGLLKRKSSDKVMAKDFFLELTKGKSLAAAVVYDECPRATPSRREDYIQELRKYVQVDEFHPCSNTSCPAEDVRCSQTLTTDYFFLLALEEDLCRDHITDIFYRAWRPGMYVVPVVRGGANYGAYFPEGTYVDADWFNSAKELGKYLADLAANRALYSELLWRKDHWQRSSKKVANLALCKLCQKLLQLPHTHKRYPDIHKWFEGNACRSPSLPF